MRAIATKNRTQLAIRGLSCVNLDARSIDYIQSTRHTFLTRSETSREHCCPSLLLVFGRPRTDSPTYGGIFLPDIRNHFPRYPPRPKHPCTSPQAPVAPVSARHLRTIRYIQRKRGMKDASRFASSTATSGQPPAMPPLAHTNPKIGVLMC